MMTPRYRPRATPIPHTSAQLLLQAGAKSLVPGILCSLCLTREVSRFNYYLAARKVEIDVEIGNWKKKW